MVKGAAGFIGAAVCQQLLAWVGFRPSTSLELGAERFAKQELGAIVGRHRTSLQRNGLRPQSKEGQLGLLEGSPLPAGKVIQRLQTSFQVEIAAARGLQLQHCLSAADLAAVTDPCSYRASQALVRQLDVEAFEVPSARAPMEPPCVDVLTPAAFASTPFDFQDWALEIRTDGVTFASFGLSQVITLLRDQFRVGGLWPDPS